MSDDSDEIEAINKRKMAELQRIAEARSVKEPVILTDTNFRTEVLKYPLILVDFWAPWCGPCRIVGPVIEQLAKEYSGKAVFGKLNVDDNPATAGLFGIQSIPTMIIFKNGKAVDMLVGALPKSQIELRLNQHMPGSSSIYG